MKLLTMQIEKLLIANHEQIHKDNMVPVVKFFGGGACTWLFTEYDPETDCFFGLCDLGMGFPELGYASKTELEELRFPPFGLPIERDRYWEPTKTLAQYAEAASNAGRIES